MKVKERETTTLEKVYELTEDELNSIKREYRNKGRYDIAGYISFALKYFHLKLNIGGAFDFIEKLIIFSNQNTTTINNIYGYSFSEWYKRYR